jgi:hypothetical protein
VLRPGEQYPVVMVFEVQSAPDVPERLRAALSQLSFRACYCSVLDQCWRSNLQSIRAEPVKECPAPEHPYAPNGR